MFKQDTKTQVHHNRRNAPVTDMMTTAHVEGSGGYISRTFAQSRANPHDPQVGHETTQYPRVGFEHLMRMQGRGRLCDLGAWLNYHNLILCPDSCGRFAEAGDTCRTARLRARKYLKRQGKALVRSSTVKAKLKAWKLCCSSMLAVSSTH